MKKEIIKSLTNTFESHSYMTENGIEFWYARDLQHLLGYTKWDNFLKVINKAKTSCEASGNNISDHFADVGKMVKIGSGTEREINDIILTRYACYLIAQNGDPRKEEIAFAQNYFAVQTRKFELIEKRIKDWERLRARQKLTLSEKELSELIYEKTGSDKNFGLIRSKGDQALFGRTTQQMKNQLGVPKGRALADFLPTITIKAKDFATEITVFNTKEKDLRTERQISAEHIMNNRSVRKILLQRGIKPEELPPEEDIKKLERRVKSESKKLGKNPDKLE
ncbi:DNA damage-inducible protein D [Candidatus Sulfidibacterium hydrothermale]|uniref:DNA damage-inducible protein D n=1 Tax=Candidatus Sulfidibacterium hydrothermale TaxID=2875962 RepID=UPI001F0AD819|nr:DNA damage-inducible protein D [Candidatus Sulfidibacterium hydrothermale]UBM62498.1 DNA damage-inducible protein D [Candidatus Sulfidibacterium hydrothermale]